MFNATLCYQHKIIFSSGQAAAQVGMLGRFMLLSKFFVTVGLGHGLVLHGLQHEYLHQQSQDAKGNASMLLFSCAFRCDPAFCL